MGEGAGMSDKVFLDYDQAELDRCYDQANFAHNQDVVHRRTTHYSAISRDILGGCERLAYGPGDMEKLDLFRATKPGQPIVIFTHGGAWKSGSSTRHHGAAEMFRAVGVNYIALDFNNIGDVGGSLFPMIDQVRRAVAWVWRNARSFEADPEQIYVIGHSSGAHLTGNVLTTDWSKYDVPQTILKGGMVVSGMYELHPVSLSARSKYVNFTPEMIAELSSIRNLKYLTCPVTVAFGTEESPEFMRQNKEFADSLQKIGKLREMVVAEGYNHFEILETINNPFGVLGRAALKMLGREIGMAR